MGDLSIHSAMRIGGISTNTWGGTLRCTDWSTPDAAKGVTMSNTSIFNSDTEVMLQPTTAKACVIENLGSGVLTGVTSNGTITLTMGNGAAVSTASGNVDWAFIAFRGGTTETIT